ARCEVRRQNTLEGRQIGAREEKARVGGQRAPRICVQHGEPVRDGIVHLRRPAQTPPLGQHAAHLAQEPLHLPSRRYLSSSPVNQAALRRGAASPAQRTWYGLPLALLVL